jgi:hypothetical protein
MANRQAPYQQFVAELRADSSQDAKEYAAFAGQSLAAVLVGQKKKVEALKPAEVESFRKRYQVAKELVQDFLQAAKASYSYEFFWQNAHQ